MAKRSKNGTAPTSSRRQKRQGKLWSFLGLIILWCLTVLLAVTVLISCFFGLRWLLFTGNQHFLLRRIEVNVNGELKRADVLAIIHEDEIRENQTNLFTVDVRRLREKLESHVLVNRVELQRQLPDTLTVNVYERRPIAQFISVGGMRIDANGRLLPALTDKSQIMLPTITGVKNPEIYTVGTEIKDQMILEALQLLRMVSISPKARLLDIATVQLIYPPQHFAVYLRAREPFVNNARVIIPVKDMAAALDRVETIANLRAQNGKSISLLDATYKNNPYVRP